MAQHLSPLRFAGVPLVLTLVLLGFAGSACRDSEDARYEELARLLRDDGTPEYYPENLETYVAATDAVVLGVIVEAAPVEELVSWLITRGSRDPPLFYRLVVEPREVIAGDIAEGVWRDGRLRVVMLIPEGASLSAVQDALPSKHVLSLHFLTRGISGDPATTGRTLWVHASQPALFLEAPSGRLLTASEDSTAIPTLFEGSARSFADAVDLVRRSAQN